MEVVGYTDRWSVQPGQMLRFMVSCEQPRYHARLLRLIHGDDNPSGPGFKARNVPSTIDGDYRGRRQSIRKGSYIEVPHHPRLHVSGAFTLLAWIYPTTPGGGTQGLLTKWSPAARAGYGLYLDGDNGLTLRLGDGNGEPVWLRAGLAMHPLAWYFVAATFDAGSGLARLFQLPQRGFPNDGSERTQEHRSSAGPPGPNDLPLLLAASWDTADGEVAPAAFFNGKIERPRLLARALEPEQIHHLYRDRTTSVPHDAVLADWDFSLDIASTHVRDTALGGLHGTAVNTPARAVTGHNWSGDHTDFRAARNHYGAIHFHDDDLEDAHWQEDFHLRLPEDLPSGVYAAHLTTQGGEDYVPFFVRPRLGRATAPIAFLVPTISYLAYADEHVLTSESAMIADEAATAGTLPYPSQPQDHYIVDQGLHSLYDRHGDLSGVCYASRLRPLANIRPKYRMPLLNNRQGAPHQLSADLHVIDWLDHVGHAVDVLTDEDLHHEGAPLLEPYSVLITGTHPEYYSDRMLDALERYLHRGGRLIYLGGNGFYWVTSIDPERPHVIEVRRWGGSRAWEAAPGERHHSTTGEQGGLWRDRGRAPQRLVGVGFTAQGVDRGRPYQRRPGSLDPRVAFIFEGVGEDELIGDLPSLVQEHGAAGFEIDRLDYRLGTPRNALLLATATGFSDVYQHVVEEILSVDSRHGGTQSKRVRSDLVYFEYPNGGRVFSVGSIAWASALSYNNYDNTVARITENVLRAFAAAK